MIKLRHTTIFSAFGCIGELSETNLSPNTLENGVNSLIKLELFYKTLVSEKGSWEEGKASWKAILKSLIGSSSA